MTSLSRNARIAGLLYLSLLTAPLRLTYIPGKLFVSGDASATGQQHRRARNAFPPGHCERSVHRDHGHLSHPPDPLKWKLKGLPMRSWQLQVWLTSRNVGQVPKGSATE
jgi:hypothetical protein